MSAAVLYVYMRSLYARRVIPLCLVVVFHNTDTHIYILSFDFALLIHNKQTQCIRGVLDPSVSVFSLSLYRHPFIYTLCNSRITLIINNFNLVFVRVLNLLKIWLVAFHNTETSYLPVPWPFSLSVIINTHLEKETHKEVVVQLFLFPNVCVFTRTDTREYGSGCETVYVWRTCIDLNPT